jgi:hypothetical protein
MSDDPFMFGSPRVFLPGFPAERAIHQLTGTHDLAGPETPVVLPEYIGRTLRDFQVNTPAPIALPNNCQGDATDLTSSFRLMDDPALCANGTASALDLSRD